MKFKIDDNLPVEVAELLRNAGYEATTVHDQNMVGENDTKLASVCQAEERVLLSLDTDFADIRSYPPHQYSGIIVIRLKHQDKNSVLKIMARLVNTLAVEDLVGHLWIVDEQRIRVRD